MCLRHCQTEPMIIGSKVHQSSGSCRRITIATARVYTAEDAHDSGDGIAHLKQGYDFQLRMLVADAPGVRALCSLHRHGLCKDRPLCNADTYDRTLGRNIPAMNITICGSVYTAKCGRHSSSLERYIGAVSILPARQDNIHGQPCFSGVDRRCSFSFSARYCSVLHFAAVIWNADSG